MSPSRPSGGSSSVLGRAEFVHREAEDVGRPRLVHELLVVGAHGLDVDEQDRQFGLRVGCAARPARRSPAGLSRWVSTVLAGLVVDRRSSGPLRLGQRGLRTGRTRRRSGRRAGAGRHHGWSGGRRRCRQHRPGCSSTIRQPAGLVPDGQVDLGDIPGHHHLRAPNPSRVRNIFICSMGGVLGLVEDDERIIDGASPHVGRVARPRSCRTVSKLAAPSRDRSCRAERRRADGRYGSILSLRVPGRKPSRSPASIAGRVRMIRFTCLACSAWTALATAR